MDDPANNAFGPYLAGLASAPGAELAVSEWTRIGIATVLTTLVRRDAAVARLSSVVAAHRAQLVDIGPAQWLFIAERADGDWYEQVANALGDVAQVFDQSSGYAVLALSGGAARPLLQKGIFVDLDTALSKDGAGLVGVAAHVSVTVWRIAADRYGVAVPRSYAGSFWHWFEAASAAEDVRPAAAH